MSNSIFALFPADEAKPSTTSSKAEGSIVASTKLADGTVAVLFVSKWQPEDKSKGTKLELGFLRSKAQAGRCVVNNRVVGRITSVPWSDVVAMGQSGPAMAELKAAADKVK